MEDLYIRVEYDPGYSDTGQFLYVPLLLIEAVRLDVKEAFEILTGLPASCIIHYSEDEVYDSEGNLVY